MGKWPQRRSRQLRCFRSEPPIIADFFLPSTPHFEAVDAASFEPGGFLRSEPAILAGFSSSSTPREEEVAAAALQSAVASFPCSEPPIIAGFFVSSTPYFKAFSNPSALVPRLRRPLRRGRRTICPPIRFGKRFVKNFSRSCQKLALCPSHASRKALRAWGLSLLSNV